jgi:D,D-heptose 1,7-bisphosphate phosphatase
VKRAVFIDKDGTLVVDVPYNVDPGRIRLAPRAAEALGLLAEAGFGLYLVSNQSGVARGYFTEDDLRPVEEHIRFLLATQGLALDGVYWCPHHPEGVVPPYAVSCTCRKPEPGMLVRAAAEHDLDLGASWVLGDILDDVAAAHRAGCRGVMVDVGNETEWVSGPGRTPDYLAKDLADAARFIVRDTARLGREEAARG